MTSDTDLKAFVDRDHGAGKQNIFLYTLLGFRSHYFDYGASFHSCHKFEMIFSLRGGWWWVGSFSQIKHSAPLSRPSIRTTKCARRAQLHTLEKPLSPSTLPTTCTIQPIAFASSLRPATATPLLNPPHQPCSPRAPSSRPRGALPSPPGPLPSARTPRQLPPMSSPRLRCTVSMAPTPVLWYVDILSRRVCGRDRDPFSDASVWTSSDGLYR